MGDGQGVRDPWSSTVHPPSGLLYIAFSLSTLLQLHTQVAGLKAQIQKARAAKKNTTIGAVASAKGGIKEIRHPPSMKLRRTLKGHFGKVYAMNWKGDSETLVSASQDGKLIIWNAVTTNKVQAIPLRSSWVMTCAFEPTKGNLIACGGLDNVCSIYNVSQAATNPKAMTELVAHDGYLSCCRFVSEKHIVTSSGDSTCILWDINTGEALKTFSDHRADVMSLAISPSNQNIFVSGSVDTTAKIWDLRNGKCVQTHVGHEADVNSVAYFPDGNAIGTGSDDQSCRLFDMRSYGEVNVFKSDKTASGITSIAFSKSGRLLFSGHEDFNCYAWDTLSDAGQCAYAMPSPHENRVSCLGVNDRGDALCTGSWDTNLKVSVN
jgi:guanine nucleotide-binding protein G(I)/G(S)/G(T) subunit beta-1